MRLSVSRLLSTLYFSNSSMTSGVPSVGSDSTVVLKFGRPRLAASFCQASV